MLLAAKINLYSASLKTLRRHVTPRCAPSLRVRSDIDVPAAGLGKGHSIAGVFSIPQRAACTGDLQSACFLVEKPRQFPRGLRVSRALLPTSQQVRSWFSRRIMGSKGSGEVSFTIPDGSKWWDSNTVAVVTGANKGIGYGIASIFAHVGLKTVVTARNEQLGEEAVAKIKQQTGGCTPTDITDARHCFIAHVIHADFDSYRLDIADPASVDTFAKWAEGHASPISILVNNAGMAFKGNVFGAEEAQTTLDTNFAGTRSVCERLAPLLADGGRVVNVCSSAGKLRILRSPELASRFTAAKSGDDVAALGAEFVQGIKSGRFEQEGWPGSMYGVSKLCEATYTRILAEELAPRNICVTACCPGYVATDMSSHRGIKTIEEGADTPAWLALLAPMDSSGKFYKDRKLEDF